MDCLPKGDQRRGKYNIRSNSRNCFVKCFDTTFVAVSKIVSIHTYICIKCFKFCLKKFKFLLPVHYHCTLQFPMSLLVLSASSFVVVTFVWDFVSSIPKKKIIGESKEINQNWTGLKNLDICLQVIFGCYDKSFISERESGH